MDADPKDVSTYARVVLPLGKRSSRLDCSKLYELEIERLQNEVRLMKMGLGAPRQIEEEPQIEPSKRKKANWTNDDGWSDEGISGKAPAKPTNIVHKVKKK